MELFGIRSERSDITAYSGTMKMIRMMYLCALTKPVRMSDPQCEYIEINIIKNAKADSALRLQSLRSCCDSKLLSMISPSTVSHKALICHLVDW